MSKFSKKRRSPSTKKKNNRTEKAAPPKAETTRQPDKQLPTAPPETLMEDERFNHSTHRTLKTDYLNFLQKTQGNGRIQRYLQGQTPDVQRGVLEDSMSWLDTQGHNIMEATGMESAEEAEQGRAKAFYAHGLYGPETYTEFHGGFDVSFDPVKGVQKIIVRGVLDCKDGLTIDGGGNIVPFSSDLTKDADKAKNLSGAEQTAFLADYQWSGAQETARAALEQSVEGAWGSGSTGLSFFVNKPHWDWITAGVEIDVQLRLGNARASDDHLYIEMIKEPAGQSKVGAEVRGSPDLSTTPAEQSGLDQEMTLSSSDIAPRTDNLLAGSDDLRDPRSVFFDHDSDVLNADEQKKLDKWVYTFQGDPTNPAANTTEVTLIGFTSASGSVEYNLDLSTRRTDAVANYLQANGFTNVNTRVMELGLGESGAVEGASEADQRQERRVELVVDSGAAQVVANHEFGHAFGLGDEYAEFDVNNKQTMIRGTGGKVGDPVSHDPLVRNMTDADGNPLPGAVHENTDSIMSLGNAVQPQHYATFHDALTKVTGIDDWSIR